MTIKTGMQHFTFGKLHTDMKDLAMPEEGNYITELSLVSSNLPKGIPGSFLLVSVLNAEIRIVIKLYAKLPAVELDDKAPAVKEREFTAVRCVSDEKIMVKPHI